MNIYRGNTCLYVSGLLVMIVGQNAVHPYFKIPFATFWTEPLTTSCGVVKSTPNPPIESVSELHILIHLSVNAKESCFFNKHKNTIQLHVYITGCENATFAIYFLFWGLCKVNWIELGNTFFKVKKRWNGLMIFPFWTQISSHIILLSLRILQL